MYRYTTKNVLCYFRLQEKWTGRCQCCKFGAHAQNFASATEKNVVPKFANRLSLTLNKICKYKDFLLAKFSRKWQNPKTYTGKYVSEKTSIFAYFTQCDVFYLLAQKRTQY